MLLFHWPVYSSTCFRLLLGSLKSLIWVSPYWEVISLWIIPSVLNDITDGSGLKMDSERRKTAIECRRNKEKGSCKASRFFILPQTTLRRYVKPGKEAQQSNKTKLCRKKVLTCEVENDLGEHRHFKQRKFSGLTVADVMHLPYPLTVRNGIKNRFLPENLKLSYVAIKKLQLQPLKVFILNNERFHSWTSCSVFLNLWTLYVHRSTQSYKTLQLRRSLHHYCTAQTHKNIRI